MVIHELANFCETVDHGFNVVGYIPIVSSITGPIRGGLWASAQMSVGLFGIPFALIVGLLAIIIGGFAAWAEMLRFFFALIVNSILNMVRGVVEAVPILGNLICFFYDRMKGKRELFPYA